MWRHKVLSALVAMFSVGWLFPLWRAIDSYLYFWEGPGMTLLLNDVPHFPGMGGGPAVIFMQAREDFRIAMVWLSVVVAFWAYIGSQKAMAKSRDA